MKIKNQRDFYAGCLVVAFGTFFAGVGSQYRIGNAASMGPGYFPTALGVITLALGLLLCASALGRRADEDRVARFSWRTLLLILGPVILFGLLLQPLGLVLSLLLLIVISSMASHEFSWRATLINATLLILISFTIFIYGLNLQFPLWPQFLR